MNKYSNRQAVCSVIALTSNEHQAKGKVPLEISDSSAGPATAHVLLAIDTPFYTVHQSLRHPQAVSLLVTPKTFCSLQIMQVLGLSLGEWGILKISELNNHISLPLYQDIQHYWAREQGVSREMKNNAQIVLGFFSMECRSLAFNCNLTFFMFASCSKVIKTCLLSVSYWESSWWYSLYLVNVCE